MSAVSGLDEYVHAPTQWYPRLTLVRCITHPVPTQYPVPGRKVALVDRLVTCDFSLLALF